MPGPRYVVVANPGGKRWETYRRELLAFWAARGVVPDVELVPWADVVPRAGCLDDLAAFDRPAVVRLESPGKSDDVTRLLLEAGAGEDAAEPPRDWRALELPKGLLVRPGLLYRGFRRVLRGLRHSFDARPHLSPTACPLAVAEMFDKTATCRKLVAAGVPVPEWLPQPLPRDPDRLLDVLLRRNWLRTYVKLNTGSSATGIVVVSMGSADTEGVTTIAAVADRFYNTRRLRRVQEESLYEALRFLLDEGAIVQRGVPMAQIDGQNFDVRVVCIHGRPAATVFRLSSNPVTNLHLGGRRGDRERCRAAIPTRAWLDALDHCAEAADCFASAVVGVDLLFERDYRRHFVLEVNAFGDFFPGWTDPRGRSVHQLELEAAARQLGAGESPRAG